jgi:hypothetical protein
LGLFRASHLKAKRARPREHVENYEERAIRDLAPLFDRARMRLPYSGLTSEPGQPTGRFDVATDEQIRNRIEELVGEEHELWQPESSGEAGDG